MNKYSTLVDTLAQSEMYRKCARAFTEATGLTLGIRPADSWNPEPGANRKGKTFCSLMAQTNASCAACLRLQDRVADAALNGPALLKCEFGLYEAAVPVKLGPQVIAFLTTGQIHLQEPTSEQVAKMQQNVERHGSGANRDEIKAAYLRARIMPRKQFEAALGLLAIFAEQLAAMSNLITTRAINAEPMPVVRAKVYIRENLQEELHLTDIAKAACTSTFYICKLFKKHAGLNLT
jgi:ligand-binding sensor protein